MGGALHGFIAAARTHSRDTYIDFMYVDVGYGAACSFSQDHAPYEIGWMDGNGKIGQESFEQQPIYFCEEVRF